MTHRLDLPSPPGTLFKRPRDIALKPRFKRLPRAPRDAEHLDAIRQCPCLSCGQDPAGEAAHVRFGSLAGMGRKPPDSETLPLCFRCHRTQHSVGELTFWASVGIDPHVVVKHLYAASPNVEKMRAMCFVAKEIGKRPE